MTQTDLDSRMPSRRSDAPLGSLAGVLVVLGGALCAASLALLGGAWVPLLAFAGLSLLVIRGMSAGYPHAVLGGCNVVTLFRATLVCFLAGAILAPDLSVWIVMGVAVLAFALDGVDGWLARRSGLFSEFGARFDMETDAVLAAVLSLWLLTSGTTGVEVLVLGFTRYAFLLAASLVPALRRDLPHSLRRKAVCAVQVGALILLVFPLTPPVLAQPVSIGASLLLLWSFARDTLWLVRNAAPSDGVRPPGGREIGGMARRARWTDPARLVLAALVFHAVLIQPAHPLDLAWSTLLRFGLELPVILLGLLAVGRVRAGAVIRATVTVGLLLLSLLKTADYAMFTALTRGMNPVGDFVLIDAGLRLLSGAIGPLATTLAVIGAVLAYAALAAALWWAAGVWMRASRQRSRGRLVAAGATAFAVLYAVTDFNGLGARLDLPLDPPGSTRSTALVVEKVDLFQATLRDLRTFEAAAASDPFVNAPGLLDLIDRDVILIFVESYGRTSLDTPFYADLHRASLAAGQAELEALGYATASGILASPTRGGQSWLAHATFANGVWVNDDPKYRAVLASGRQTLFHLAGRAGFQTAAVMPQITLDWPESSVMGFETILAAEDLGYEGENFNWVTMPDQFTYHALDRILIQSERDRPLFVQVATGTSHAPWVPVPDLVAWDEIGDGRIFNEMATSGDSPREVWQDRDRVREQYRLAIDYALRTIFSFAAQKAGDPPLFVVVGDHQSAEFVALDDRPDVPIHVIGPRHLVDRTQEWGLAPGLIPPDDTAPMRMDQMRDKFLRAFSSAGFERHAAR